MKHLKEFENLNNMIPGMMYMTPKNTYFARTIGYVNKNDNLAFPITAIVFKTDDKRNSSIDNKIFITEYSKVDMIPLNISIKDYIIQNNIILETLDILKTYSNYKGLSKQTKEMCYKFYDELIEDDDINIILQTDKYNL